MKTPGERLAHLRARQGYSTLTSLAEAMGISTATLNAHEKGTRAIKTHVAERYAKFLKSTPEWLLLGVPQSPKTGSPFVASFDPDGEPEEFDEGNAAVSTMGRKGLTTVQIPEHDTRGGLGGGGTPLLTEIRDGNVSFAAETVRAAWEFPPSFLHEELRLSPMLTDVLRVRGDSMDDGTIHALRDGDRVIIDRSDRSLRQGGIFAVAVYDEVIIKQVELVPGSDPTNIVCKSLNKRYSDQVYVLDDEARVIGRVAGAITRR